MLSSGKNGTVHRIPGTYRVLKIDFDRKKCSKNGVATKNVNNIAADAGLAPRIYSWVTRSDGCHIEMDYTPGTNLYRLIHKGLLTSAVLNKVFLAIKKLHQHLEHGHGDMNFGNILVTGKGDTKISFVDFTLSYGNYNTRDSVLDYWQMLFYANKNKLQDLVPEIMSRIAKEYSLPSRQSFDIDLDFRLRFLFIFMTYIQKDPVLYSRMFLGKEAILNEDLLRYLIFFSHHREACVRKFDKFFKTFIVNTEINLPEQAFIDLDDFVINFARE